MFNSNFQSILQYSIESSYNYNFQLNIEMFNSKFQSILQYSIESSYHYNLNSIFNLYHYNCNLNLKL